MTTMSSAFADSAVTLAAIGLYAVLAFGIAQRFREIGIRIAVGATPRDIRRLVLGQVARISIVGVVIGAALALGLGRLSQTMLFGVERTAPAIVAGAVVLALGVAFAAAVTRTPCNVRTAGPGAESRIAPSHRAVRVRTRPSTRGQTLMRSPQYSKDPSRNGPLPYRNMA